MDWKHACAPDLATFERLARDAYEQIPPMLREACGDVVIRIEDFAPDTVLDELGLDDPFELTGLYQGVDLTQKSTLDSSAEPDFVFLYRRPILDEWCENGEVELGHLIAHVLIHEIGHHFGFSDEDMHRVEEEEG